MMFDHSRSFRRCCKNIWLAAWAAYCFSNVKIHNVLAQASLVNSNNRISSAEALQWKDTDLEVTVKPSDAEALARFSFQNVSASSVKIVALSTSCSCVHAVANKKVYAPQEKGEIVVTFTPTANQLLTRDSMVLVETDAPDRARTELLLTTRVSIMSLGTFEPSSLTWVDGEPLHPKTIKYRLANDGGPVKDVNVVSTDSKAITAQIKCLKVGSEYEIVATPAAESDTSLQAKLIVRTIYVNGRAGRTIVLVNIH